MEIRDRSDHDPVADLLLVDAYMRWALLAAEEVIGRNGLAVVLRQAGLSHLIGNYPPEQLKATTGLTFYHYASLNAGLINFLVVRRVVWRCGSGGRPCVWPSQTRVPYLGRLR
ncbi:hypothetical protein [Chloroflexus sp.]|uniref:hypothetical protein n=1 Tax=Chloroflexus sp. TaxID=1904827 RepID=UPI004049956F